MDWAHKIEFLRIQPYGPTPHTVEAVPFRNSQADKHHLSGAVLDRLCCVAEPGGNRSLAHHDRAHALYPRGAGARNHRCRTAVSLQGEATGQKVTAPPSKVPEYNCFRRKINKTDDEGLISLKTVEQSAVFFLLIYMISHKLRNTSRIFSAYTASCISTI